MENKDRQSPRHLRRDINAQRPQQETSSPQPKIIATHTVGADETLSHIALKYYKRATPPFWKYLLEHNKEVLKGNERNVRKGMALEIPELPEALKDE